MDPDDSIAERARITHTDGEPQQFCEEWIEIGGDEEEITHSECWFDYDYQAQIRRSVVVGDTLYTLSDRGLLSTDLASLEPGEFLPFAVG